MYDKGRIGVILNSAGDYRLKRALANAGFEPVTKYVNLPRSFRVATPRVEAANIDAGKVFGVVIDRVGASIHDAYTQELLWCLLANTTLPIMLVGTSEQPGNHRLRFSGTTDPASVVNALEEMLF